MRFCIYCGEKLRNGAKFCDKCGKPLLSQSNIKRNENKKQESKSSMPSSCPHCKVPLLLNSYYTNCPSCDFKLRNDTESHDTVQKQPKDLQTPSICPYCGTPLNSFMLNCPACGCEVRKPKEASSVRELALKLEKLESQRTPPPSFPKSKKDGLGLKKSIVNMYFGSKEDEYHKELDKYEMMMDQIDDKKIDVIRNFPIPNTIEDLYVFLVWLNLILILISIIINK